VLDVASGDSVPKDVLEAADSLSSKAAVRIDELPREIPATGERSGARHIASTVPG
jgi:hypothetical protein